MKNRFLFAFVLSLAVFCSCEQEAVRVAGITLDYTSVTLVKGEEFKLNAILSPSDVSNTVVIWASDNADVARVSLGEGLVTAVDVGEACIQAKSDDGGLTAYCAVTVIPDRVAVTGISLDNESLVLNIGDAAKLVAVVEPEDATNKSFNWRCSDAAVIQLAEEGDVKALAAGTADIIVATEEGGFIATCTITVVPDPVPVTGIGLDENSLTLSIGGTAKLIATVAPENASDKKYSWSCSAPSVASVSETGGVKALSAGDATITVTTADGGFTASCSVTVVPDPVPVTGISLDKENLVLQQGESSALVATVAPDNASNKSFTWKCTDPAVVELSETGTVKALSTGTAHVIVTSEDGGFSASCKIVVEQHVNGLSLDESEFTLRELERKTIKATVTPDDAEDKSLLWESSDPLVASVSNGEVLALRASPTPVIITAKTKDKGLSASCTVHVVCDVKGVKLDEHSISMNVGQELELEYAVYPSRATNKSVTWASDKRAVVSVSEAGVLTARRKGVATVTVTSVDGSFSDSCVVMVENDIKGMSINPASLDLTEDETSQLQVVFESGNEVTGEKVNWYSTNEKVVTVDGNGLVKAVYAGEAAVVASTEGGHLATCRVSVRKLVNSMSLEPASITLFKARFESGDNTQLNVFTPVIDPKDARVQLKWTSSNENVAKVDAGGKVTPVSSGDAVITATVPNDDPAKVVTATATVKVIQEATKITVSPNTIEMWDGGTDHVDIDITPAGADSDYRAFLDGNSTAQVTFDKPSGTLKAITPGTAKFVFKPTVGFPQTIQAECAITVLAHVRELKIDGDSACRMPLGGTLSLKSKVVFVPENAANKDLKWSSSNESVAKVDGNGVVSGNKAGTATITATAKDDYKNAAVSFTVQVCETQVKSITIEPIELYAEETKKLTRTIEPADVWDPSLHWESSNNFYATVDQDGNVTGLQPGTVTITATSISTPGVSAKCGVTILSKVVRVTSVSLSKSFLELGIGNSTSITAQVLPNDAANRNISWKIEPEGIASIAPSFSSCYITALAEGNAVITVTTEDGGFTSTCSLSVYKPKVPAETISLNKTELVLAYGNSETLTATVGPDTATDKTVSWGSDDDSIAMVTPDGTVVAMNKEGRTTIRAISNGNTNLSATCSVKVVPKIVHVTGLTIQTENGTSPMVMSVGQKARVIAIVTPTDATDKSVRWSVQQGGVIFIDSEGYVTASKAGVSRVIAEAVDGGRTATMQVKVIENKVDHIVVKYNGEEIQSLIVKAGSTIELKGEAIGEDPTLPPTSGDLYWTSNPGSVVSVTNGMVTGITAGDGSITVKSIANPNIQKTLQVKVLAPGSGGNEGMEFDDWNF